MAAFRVIIASVFEPITESHVPQAFAALTFVQAARCVHPVIYYGERCNMVTVENVESKVKLLSSVLLVIFRSAPSVSI